jgi:hypothetical protein
MLRRHRTQDDGQKREGACRPLRLWTHRVPVVDARVTRSWVQTPWAPPDSAVSLVLKTATVMKVTTTMEISSQTPVRPSVSVRI